MTRRRDPRSRTRKELENEIQRQIQANIGAEPDLLLIRNSIGHAEYTDEDTAKSWHVPYGLGTGSPDLVGILRVPRVVYGSMGLWFCLEVKCPGEDAEPEQEKCHAQWRAFGAFVRVVHSVNEARAALVEARNGVAT